VDRLSAFRSRRPSCRRARHRLGWPSPADLAHAADAVGGLVQAAGACREQEPFDLRPRHGRQRPAGRSTARRSEIDYAAVTAMFIKGQRPEKPACSSASYPGRLVATALTLASVASILSGSVDRTVVDHTGLTGTFDLELEAVEIRPPGPFGPSFRPSDTKQSIFMALPQQLGLALEAMQGTVDVLVIDSAEQPTPSNP
jgi:uncharacterized protein (TIGR03435 family)